MNQLTTIRSIVYPARDLTAGISAWSKILGDPVYQNDSFATFATKGGIDIGLSSLPWVDYPLVFWKVDDIDKAHTELLETGATALGEVRGGTLDEIGKQPVTNGDSRTGIVTVPGRKMATFRLADGSLLGIAQDMPMQW